ncbi:uncharacterized protein RJT20DRAFT_130922 [Scheffersomyces xylosifermentans]|uniref:uncharacterized protein n=1 Tax=Scheffersomyces xylosifermentans TaxID=1304137 RepID=UPI00315DB10B
MVNDSMVEWRQVNSIIHHESFLPDALIKKVKRNIPRSLPYYDNNENEGTEANDPIIRDLKKLYPHKPVIVTEIYSNRRERNQENTPEFYSQGHSENPDHETGGDHRGIESEESIASYSSKLQELLNLLIEEKHLDDNIRISIENSLFELTSYLPTPLSTWTWPAQPTPQLSKKQKQKKKQLQQLQNLQHHPIYPNGTFSKILIDNYNLLLKFSSTYFNLSLSSHITRYMVELIYSLQYWEVYHLIYILPNLEYFLKLLNFEVIQTAFGPLIRPPENYLNNAMQAGLLYPFPYPFYNYSYHSFAKNAESVKYDRIHITPYVDITLKDANGPSRKKQKIKVEKEVIPEDEEDDDEDDEEDEDEEYEEVKKESTFKHTDGATLFNQRHGDQEIALLSEPQNYTESESNMTDSDQDEMEFEDEADGRRLHQEDGISTSPEVTSQAASVPPEEFDSSKFEPSDAPQNLEYNDKPSDESSSDEEDRDTSMEASEFQEYQQEMYNQGYDPDQDDMQGSSEMGQINSKSNPIFQFQNQLRFIAQSPKKSAKLAGEMPMLDDKNKKAKSGVIHQCHLIDPGTMRKCLKIFYGKNELLRHQEFVHATKKKIYKCIYCSRNGAKVQSYPRHDSLARHIRRKHGVTGKENKMAVNYAKENVEIIDDPKMLVTKQHTFVEPLPHPQFLNPDFTIKSSYAGFLSFSTKDTNQHKAQAANQHPKNRIVDVIELPPIAQVSPPQGVAEPASSSSIAAAANPEQLQEVFLSPIQQRASIPKATVPTVATVPYEPSTPTNLAGNNAFKSLSPKETFQRFRVNNPTAPQPPVLGPSSISSGTILPSIHELDSKNSFGIHSQNLQQLGNPPRNENNIRKSMDLSYLNSPEDKK